MTPTSPDQPGEKPGESAQHSDSGDSVLSGGSSATDADDPYSPSAAASGSEASAGSGESSSPATWPADPASAGEGQAGASPAPGFQATPTSGYDQRAAGYTPPPSDPYAQGQAPGPYGQAGQPPAYGGQGQGYQPPTYAPQQPGYPPQGGYQQPPQGGYPQQGAYDPAQPGQAGGPYAPPPPAYPNQPGYPPQQYAGQPTGAQPMSQSDERLWATLSHISIPFIGVVGPLIVYLVFKDRSAFVKDQATESLNFSILYTIAQIAGWILSFVLIGFILLPLVFIGALVLCIMAAIAANKGEAYRYPVNWRMIK